LVLHRLRPPLPALPLGARSILVGIAIAAGVFVSIPAVALAESGSATWYGPGFQGNIMYSGRIYDMYDPTTTACNIYPMGTWLKVTNPANGHSVVVQVRDRGAFPWAFDLSYAAFKILANPSVMMIKVTYQVVSGPDGQTTSSTPAKPQPAPESRAAPSASATQFVVRPGDTLSGIASSFNIDQDTLAQWNGISDPNSLAQGQTLRLTAPPATTAVAAAGIRYVVKLGDSLLAIAGRFGLSLEQIAATNNLADPYPIVEGQTLVIPTAAVSPKGHQYIVRAGDTIYGIASKLGVSPASLQTLNQIGDPLTIQPGEVLQVPAS
jgi:LysM repeat protein